MDAAETTETDAARSITSKSGVIVQRARHRLRNIGALIASFAAVGAIASGLLGYWNVWKTLRTEILHETQSAQKEGVTKPNLAPRLSLIVLPFTNVNHDPTQDYFADAITNDLTTDLAKISGAFVIGRGTAFAYKDKQIDLRALGKELGVRWAVQGAVQRNGEQVRVNAALTDLTTGGDAWSDRFDGDLSNLAALQDGIVARLARSLDVNLVRAEARRAESEGNLNPDAIDLVMRGWAKYYEQSTTFQKISEARKVFEEALRLDPGNVDAMIGVATTVNATLATNASKSRADDFALAKKMVEMALSKRPDSAILHAQKAAIARNAGQPEDALLEYDRALEIDPNLVLARAGKYWALLMVGRPLEALMEAQTALKLSPKDPLVPVFHQSICDARLHLRQFNEAIDACERSLALRPDWFFNYSDLAGLYGYLGKVDEASRMMAEARKRNPKFTVKQFYDYMHMFACNPKCLEGWEPLVEGFRKAGLPEQ